MYFLTYSEKETFEKNNVSSTNFLYEQTKYREKKIRLMEIDGLTGCAI